MSLFWKMRFFPITRVAGLEPTKIQKLNLMVFQNDRHSKMKWFWCPFNRTLSIISIFCAPGLWLSSSRWRLFAIATSLLYVPSKLRRGGSEWLSAVFPHMATYPHSPFTLYISFLLSFLYINIITKFLKKIEYFLINTKGGRIRTYEISALSEPRSSNWVTSPYGRFCSE